jgi:hypothetical protein
LKMDPLRMMLACDVYGIDGRFSWWDYCNVGLIFFCLNCYQICWQSSVK